MSTWKEIVRDPEFQQLDMPSKRRVLQGWFRDNVGSDPEYQKLSPEQKFKVLRGHEVDAGLYQEPQKTPLLKQFVTGTVEELPTTGAMFGGAIGAAPGIAGTFLTGGSAAPVTIPVSAGGGVIGAGLGAGMGESLKQTLQQSFPEYFGVQPKTTLEQYKQIGKSGVIGAASEAGGQVAFKGIEKLLAPGASKMTSEGKALLEKAAKQDLPLSPDVFTKSRFTKSVVKIMDEVPPGNWAMAKKRADLAAKLTHARSQFITDVLDMPAPGQLEGLKAQMKARYKEVAKMGEGAYDMPTLKNYLEMNISNPHLQNTSKQFRDILDEATSKLAKEKVLSFDDTMDIYAKIWRNFNKMGPVEKAARGELLNALNADIKAIDEKMGLSLYDALQLAKGSAKSVSEAKYSAFIEKMLQRSTDYDAAKEIYSFKPLKFKAELQKALPNLERMFSKDPEKLELIKRFAAEMESAATDVSRLSKFQAPGMLEKGAGAAALLYQPLLTVPAGFDVWMAHSLMNPKGWMKKWLTTGLEAGAGSRLTKEAVKPITFDIFNKRENGKGK